MIIPRGIIRHGKCFAHHKVSLLTNSERYENAETALDRALEINLDGWPHGGLDVNLSDVLPLFLEEGSQEVGSKLNVYDDLILVHANISDSDVEAHDLLHLKLNGGLDFVDLFLHIITTGEKGREFSSLGKTWSKKTRDLLDHVIGSKEEIVLLGELLNQLLVLVQLLQVLNTHMIHSNTISLFAMDRISKHAALEIWARDSRQSESAGETLVADRVVVLQRDLNLDGLSEVTLLSSDLVFANDYLFPSRESQDIGDSFVQQGRVQLRHDWL